MFSSRTPRMGTKTLFLTGLTVEVTEICCLCSVIAAGAFGISNCGVIFHQTDSAKYGGGRETTACGDISPKKS